MRTSSYGRSVLGLQGTFSMEWMMSIPLVARPNILRSQRMPYQASRNVRVFVIEPRCRYGSNEELRPVRSWSSICHGQSIRPVMPEFWIELVFKVTAPATLSARSISKRITSLQHELFDDSMEDDIIVITIIDVRDEVLDRLRRSFREQLEVLRVSRVSEGGGPHTISPMVVWIVNEVAVAFFFSGATMTVCSSLVGLSLNTSRSPFSSLSLLPNT